MNDLKKLEEKFENGYNAFVRCYVITKPHLNSHGMNDIMECYTDLNKTYREMIVSSEGKLDESYTERFKEIEAKVVELHELYNEMLKSDPSIKTAEWKDKDEWDNYTCSRCGYKYGEDDERYCSNCGSFMTNHKPTMYSHHFCEECGTELNEFTGYPLEGDIGRPYDMIGVCKKCGHKNYLSYAGAVKEIACEGFSFDFIKKE